MHKIDVTPLITARPLAGSLSRDEMIARARALLPAVAAHRAAADAGYDLPAELVAEMKAAGLFRGFQPARWGGLECDPRIVLDVQSVFAEVCLSTAWIHGVLSLQSFILSRFGERAQADVWADNPDALLSSSGAPVGKVTRVDGGYRITGRYTYSSGSSHADWALIGGMVPPPAGIDEPPHMCMCLIPRQDYTIADVWRTIGLKGTGSNDLVVEDAFIPEHRTFRTDGGIFPLPPESGLPALYRLPWIHIASSMVSNIAVGGTRGAARAFADATRGRRGANPATATAENPAYLAAIARAHAEIDIAELVAHRNFGQLFGYIDGGPELDPAEAYTIRTQLTGSLRKLMAVVDEMMRLMGGRGIREGEPFTRYWLDLTAACAHVGNDPAPALALLGGALDDQFAGAGQGAGA